VTDATGKGAPLPEFCFPPGGDAGANSNAVIAVSSSDRCSQSAFGFSASVADFSGAGIAGAFDADGTGAGAAITGAEPDLAFGSVVSAARGNGDAILAICFAVGPPSLFSSAVASPVLHSGGAPHWALQKPNGVASRATRAAAKANFFIVMLLHSLTDYFAVLERFVNGCQKSIRVPLRGLA
jgi:hypothetical protein